MNATGRCRGALLCLAALTFAPAPLAAQTLPANIVPLRTALDMLPAPVPAAAAAAAEILADSLPAAPILVGAGRASFYGRRFAGRPTASGEIFDPAQMTAAHRTLPFGTMLRVTDERSGKSVVVRVNDRGPFIRGRILDLSRAAAEKLGIVRRGVARVRLHQADGL